MSPIRKGNKIELGASCFGTNTLRFPRTYTIVEEKTPIHMKGPSSLLIILKIKRILSHIYKIKI